MKKIILFNLTLLLSAVTFAQEEFSFELYLEDALGNRDTLVLGYDVNATDSIDIAFGELNIVNQPWDSVFEVRAGDISNAPSPLNSIYQSKKQIIDKSCNFDFHILINMVSVNYPVTIKWDTLNFINDSCRMASILSCCSTLESDYYNGPSIYLSNKYASLVHSGDSLIIDPNIWNGLLQSYTNGNSDISIMWLSFANPANFSSVTVKEIDVSKVKIYPNPAQNEILLELNGNSSFEYSVTTISGKLVQSGISNNKQIPIESLSNGYYILKVIQSNRVYGSSLIISR